MDKLKQSATTLERQLASKEGFKNVHGGGFLGGKAGKSFAVWSAAEKKAVLPLCLVQHFEHQDNDTKSYYGIYAFSTKGEIDANALARLKAAAQKIDLETVRYESLEYTRLELWRAKGEAFAQAHNTIATSLSDVANGLFVYAEAVGSGSNAILDKPLVIYAHENNGDYIYPVKKTTLSEMNID
ncbi:MAG: hypothetical protein LBC19_05620 [Tannerella sp.]|jgi:hypothetical protein|nr:hypothetical protein [Tannerella sp.]